MYIFITLFPYFFKIGRCDSSINNRKSTDKSFTKSNTALLLPIIYISSALLCREEMPTRYDIYIIVTSYISFSSTIRNDRLVKIRHKL